MAQLETVQEHAETTTGIPWDMLIQTDQKLQQKLGQKSTKIKACDNCLVNRKTTRFLLRLECQKWGA